MYRSIVFPQEQRFKHSTLKGGTGGFWVGFAQTESIRDPVTRVMCLIVKDFIPNSDTLHLRHRDRREKLSDYDVTEAENRAKERRVSFQNVQSHVWLILKTYACHY